jgi:cell division protease FtsH
MKQPATSPNGRATRWSRSFVVQAAVCLLVFFLIRQFVVAPMAARAVEMPYSQFKADLRSGNVQTVTIGKDQITGTLKDPSIVDGKPFNTIAIADPDLPGQLEAAGIVYRGQPSGDGGLLGTLVGVLLPFALMAGFFYFFVLRGLRGMTGGKGGAGGIFSFGKSKAVPVTGEQTGVTFADVGGADEAVGELREVVDYLKHPDKYQRLGGRIPKGVLLVGPPGAGKTLLARATAGEAGVTFYSITGSSFVEMFVGVGAARVRDLFEQAKVGAPSIVFIDEIDAVGRQRSGASAMNTHEEREQTLNQLLSEMDGFEANKGVIIMAATNRPEILDPALLRAGRFDRQVVVDVPDLIGREQILNIHLRNVELAQDAVVATIARMTPGFTGADLANIVNEAALLAARVDKPQVTLKDFEDAIERVVAGLERRTRVMSESEKRVVAYHEAGHALVANLLPGADPVRKVSIVPRGKGALGYTLQLPIQDRYVLTQREIEARLAVLMGGRAAEEVVFESPSTGASDDLARATDLARRMVAEFGMSPKLGPVRYSGDGVGGYLGPDMRLQPGISPETASTLDREIRRIVEDALGRAKGLLLEHRPSLDGLAEGLLRKEVLDGEEMATIIESSKAPNGRAALPSAV